MGLHCVYMVLNRIIPGDIAKNPAPGTKEDSSQAAGKRAERPKHLYLIAQMVQNLTTWKLLHFQNLLQHFVPYLPKKMNDSEGFSNSGKQNK